MRGRPSPWLILVIVLLGVLVLREPRLQQMEDVFLSWFLQQSQPLLPPARVTLVEISRAEFQKMPPPPPGTQPAPSPAKDQLLRSAVSPLEYALFLQSVLEFQPPVIAIEPVLMWRERDKDQEQVFIDQAMRVPKLLVGIELGDKGKHDLAPDEVPTFSQVSGRRGNLAEFPGISRQPDDDIRLIAAAGFVNLPGERTDRIRVPMLFEYRGEIVPSFPLEAILLWLRATPAEVKVELGSQIVLPNGWKIPIRSDGTTTINPVAAKSIRRLTLNELLLAAQEHASHRPPTINLENLKDQIVLFRIADDPLQPLNVFGPAIATIQNNAYVGQAPWIYSGLIIFVGALLGAFLWRISKSNFFLGAIVLTAGYSMVALALLSKNHLWIPTFLPFVLLWFLVLVRLFGRAPVKERLSS